MLHVAECVRKLRTNFGRREALSAPHVRYLVKKVKETDILTAKPMREKPKTVRIPENITAVAESVCEAPSTSIHCRSQQLNISETLLRRILHKDLGMMPYKLQLVQELKSIDHPMRFRFAKWACDRLTEDVDFRKIKPSFQMRLILILAGMKTSKIVEFEAQKTRTNTLKSRRTQNESMLGADFGPEVSLGHFSSKMSKKRPL